ncbi:MAG: universal stress protein [Halobacteriota archaeon]
MSTRVLVPIDGSPLSRRALRHALEEFPHASVTVYHVIDLFEPGTVPIRTSKRRTNR